MRKNIVPLVFAALLVFFGTGACAQMSEEAKIECLIGAIAKTPAGTTFVRNGREYAGERAAAHLRTKYANGKKHAATAGLFIENIASRSSMSGIDYRVKFVDGKTVTAREFFTEELKKIEQSDAASMSSQDR